MMYRSWSIREIEDVKPNGCTVFSVFSCGGGSSMGYKLAGYDVIGHCDIDKPIAEMYMKNNHPLYSFNMDIRDFLLLKDLPEELFNLDILDGSPPCSVFSIAGKREDDWGRAKRFREGQKKQTLDDLFFKYIELLNRLQPKIFVAENVKGLISGNAKGYVAEIIREVSKAGYDVQMFCLNSAVMGIPQRRERVFFIGHKKELGYKKLKLNFHEAPILFREVREEGGRRPSKLTCSLLQEKRRTDRKLSDINKRIYGRNSRFGAALVWDNMVAPTITANGEFIKANKDKLFSDMDFINCQTFPYDYNFCGNNVQYVCGMSVPPLMMQKVAAEIYRQWLAEQ